ncbi:MAG: hypothetical protein Kow0022_09620 [Phycisphaerales bacterium]
MSPSAWDEAGKVKRTHKRRRLVLAAVGVLLLTLVVLVIFAPAIASPFARSIIAQKASAAIEGNVEVRRVHLSWTGPQRVTGLRILERDRQVVADVDLNVGVGLVSLAMGGRDLGTIGVTGVANIRRDEAGRINAAEAIRPAGQASKPAPARRPAPAGSGGGSIPSKLRAKLDLSGLSIHYSDPALRRSGVEGLSLRAVTGTGGFAPGVPLTFQAKATIASDGRSDEQGTISITASVSDLVDAAGMVTMERATLEARATVQALNPALIARLVDAPIDIEKAAGSPVSVTVTAGGSVLAPDAGFEMTAANAEITGKVGLEDQTLVLREPLVVALNRQALAAVDRAWLAQMTGGSLEVNEMPTVRVSVSTLRVPLSGPLLDSLAVEGAFEIGAMDASVRVGEGEAAVMRRIVTQPASFTAASESLASGLDCAGSIAFQVDGSDGGTLTLNVSASDLVQSSHSGAAPVRPRVRGTLALEGVDTAVVQPLVAAAGVDMLSEAGPRLNMRVELAPDDEDATVLHALVASQNINADFNLRFAGSRLVSTELPSQLRAGSIGPLLSRLLAEMGIRVSGGASLDIALQQLDLDLASMLDGGVLSPDDLNARAEVILGPTSGTIARTGRSHSFDLEQVGLLVQFVGPARAAQIRLATGGALDGRPAGNLVAEFRLDELLGSDGSWQVGMPAAVRGRAELTGLNSSLLEPFVTLEGTSMAELVGSTVDLVIAASPGGERTTRIVLSLTSEQITGDGGFLLSPDLLTLDASGLTFTHAALAPALASLVDLGPAASVRRQGGQIEWALTHFQLPLDPQTRAPLLERLLLGTRLSVRDIYVDRPNLPASDQFELRQLVVRAQVKPGQPGTADVAALAFDRRRPARMDAHLELPGLIDALTGKAPFSVASLRPSGTLAAPELYPAVLIEALALAPLPGVDVAALAGDLAGETFSVQADLNTVDDKLGMKLAARGLRFRIDAAVAIGDRLESGTFTSQVNLSRAAADQLVRALAPRMLDTVELAGPAALRVAGSLKADRSIQADFKVVDLSIAGLESQPVSFALDATLRTSLPDVAGKDRPLSVTFQSAAKDSSGAGVASATGDLTMMIGGEVPGAISGTVRVAGLRSAWVDKALGSEDFYQGLIGASVAITADATHEQAHGATRFTVDIQAPRLASASKLSGTLRSGAIVLDQPYSATWTGDSAWLSRRLQSSLEDKAPSVDAPVRLALDLRQLTLPAATQRVPDVVLLLDLEARVPQIDITMPGGEKRSYRSLVVTARSNSDHSGINARIGADVTIAGGPASRAIDVTAFVRALVVHDVLTLDRAYVNADAVLRHIPTSVVDALAGTGGLLVDMLGSEVAIDDLKIRRAPAEGGTVSLTATSTNARAVIAGTITDAEKDGRLVDGFLVVDSKSFLELSRISKELSARVFSYVPLVVRLQRDPNEDRPSRIRVNSMRLPLKGGLSEIEFSLLADLGSMKYTPGIELPDGVSVPFGVAMPDLGGQREILARVQPFDITMAGGVIAYDRLKLPIGEFELDSRGTIDLVHRSRNLVAVVPLGELADEGLRLPGPIGNLAKGLLRLGLTNSGPIDGAKWGAKLLTDRP